MPLGGSSSQLIHPRLLEQLQASAVGDAGMPDECTVTNPATGDGTVDEFGNWIPPVGTVVHGPSGACRAQATNQSEQRVVVGQEVVTLHPYMVAIPADAGQVVVDAIVHIDTSGDPHLQDRDLIVRSVHHTSVLARRLLLCDDHPDEGSA